jgi:hypothetical protein
MATEQYKAYTDKPMRLSEHFNQGRKRDLMRVVLLIVNLFKNTVPNALHKISQHAIPLYREFSASNPTLILEYHLFSAALDCFKGRV